MKLLKTILLSTFMSAKVFGMGNESLFPVDKDLYSIVAPLVATFQDQFPQSPLNKLGDLGGVVITQALCDRYAKMGSFRTLMEALTSHLDVEEKERIQKAISIRIFSGYEGPVANLVVQCCQSDEASSREILFDKVFAMEDHSKSMDDDTLKILLAMDKSQYLLKKAIFSFKSVFSGMENTELGSRIIIFSTPSNFSIEGYMESMFDRFRQYNFMLIVSQPDILSLLPMELQSAFRYAVEAQNPKKHMSARMDAAKKIDPCYENIVINSYYSIATTYRHSRDKTLADYRGILEAAEALIPYKGKYDDEPVLFKIVHAIHCPQLIVTKIPPEGFIFERDKVSVPSFKKNDAAYVQFEREDKDDERFHRDIGDYIVSLDTYRTRDDPEYREVLTYVGKAPAGYLSKIALINENDIRITLDVIAQSLEPKAAADIYKKLLSPKLFPPLVPGVEIIIQNALAELESSLKTFETAPINPFWVAETKDGS